MSTRNRIALSLTALSILLLVPGLVKPILTITASMEMFGVRRELFTETRSILGAIRTLHDSGNDFVAALILFFSVLVPLVKASLLAPLFLMRDQARRYQLFEFIHSISKWSMADVFAVGVFIALLAAKATDNMTGVAGQGFYYFAAYCIVSNAAFHVLRIDAPAAALPAADDAGPGSASV
ncbi:MAG: paraquat-inducible protein A [Gemmatimonadota bacterium]|nr:paraquat-inducible protein A [Gemmatimonadota bacterium]